MQLIDSHAHLDEIKDLSGALAHAQGAAAVARQTFFNARVFFKINF